MTVNVSDQLGNSLTIKVSSGLMKYQMEDDFGEKAGEDEDAMVMMKELARAHGVPLIDMDEVQEAMEAKDEEEMMDDFLVEVEDKVAGEVFAFEIETTRVEDPPEGIEDKGTFFKHDRRDG